MKFVGDNLIICSDCREVPCYNGEINVYTNQETILCQNCYDKEDDDKFEHIPIFENIINNYKVHCENALCNSIVCLKNLAEHLRICKFTQKKCFQS